MCGRVVPVAITIARPIMVALVEPVAVGQKLPEMPLFLEPDRYILTPLEPTYLDAFAAVPKRWRDELGPAVA